MPAFSKLWPFNSGTARGAGNSDNDLARGIQTEQSRQEGGYMMSALQGQADTNASCGVDGDGMENVVESVEKEQDVNEEQAVSDECGGGSLRKDASREKAAAEVDCGDAGEEVVPPGGQPGDDVEEDKDGKRAQSEGVDKDLEPPNCENIVEIAPQVDEHEKLEVQTAEASRVDDSDNAHASTEDANVEYDQMTDHATGNYAADRPHGIDIEGGNEKPAAASSDHEQAVPSSPLRSYQLGFAKENEQSTIHDDSQSEPSSDSVFMQQMSAHFGGRPSAGDELVDPLEEASKNISDDAVEYHHKSNGKKDSKKKHLKAAQSAKVPGGSRREIVDHGHTKHHGPSKHSQKFLDELFRHTSPPISEDGLYYPYDGQYHTPRRHGSTTPTVPHGPDPPTRSGGNKTSTPANQKNRKSAPSSRKEDKQIRVPEKRKYEEDSEEEDEEMVDEYEPSHSGEESDSDSDSEEDVPLKDRKNAYDTAGHRKRQFGRSGSDSQSSYQDEDGDDEDEDKDEEDGSDENEEEQTNEEVAVVSREDASVRSPTPGPVGDVMEEPASAMVTLPLPTEPVDPPAMQRALPVPQPTPATEATPSDEISFKLPPYNVELVPQKAADDSPEVKVSLPGMPREVLILTVDHGFQEFHLLENLFIPGQQSLSAPPTADESRYALLNFHTVATMVLESYAVHEEGDVVTEVIDKATGNQVKLTEGDVRQATLDEIFFATMDRWRVGLADESLKPSYKMIRGVQEFCDIALDIIYYLEENGFVEGELKVRKERRDKGIKKATKKDKAQGKGGKAGKKVDAAGASEEGGDSAQSTPKKRGRPKKSESKSPEKGKGKVNELHPRKKPKTTPKAPPKKPAKATVSVKKGKK